MNDVDGPDQQAHLTKGESDVEQQNVQHGFFLLRLLAWNYTDEGS